MNLTSLATLLAADLVAIGVLVFGLYLPRHHRRDLMVSFLGINVGVFTVSAALASSSVGAGLGLGLLGVLSIIRLRSDELGQREVAYYFAALAIGLLGGLAPSPLWVAVAGMVLVVVVMAIVDSPRLMPSSRNRVVVLDRAFLDETELHRHLEDLLDARVRSVHVQRLDLVNDTTIVDVRYVAIGDGATGAASATGRLAAPGAAAAATRAAAAAAAAESAESAESTQGSVARESVSAWGTR
ncbi:MAG: DUF4956 domain-containing protein [Salana multivorans]|nr:DUF4956 domain-containing protein [Salana multivorans]